MKPIADDTMTPEQADALWRKFVRHKLRDFLPPSFPTIVVLCGSTRFGDAYRDAMRTETLAGRIVLTVGLLGHAEGIDMNGPVKAMLDRLHLDKIFIADEVMILNPGGYVGESTRRELTYARQLGKVIRSLEPLNC